jgi:hypothetical protein
MGVSRLNGAIACGVIRIDVAYDVFWLQPPDGSRSLPALPMRWSPVTASVSDYSPMRTGPNPTAGFLLAGFVLYMFVSCGVWGAVGDDEDDAA